MFQKELLSDLVTDSRREQANRRSLRGKWLAVVALSVFLLGVLGAVVPDRANASSFYVTDLSSSCVRSFGLGYPAEVVGQVNIHTATSTTYHLSSQVEYWNGSQWVFYRSEPGARLTGGGFKYKRFFVPDNLFHTEFYRIVIWIEVDGRRYYAITPWCSM